MASVDHFVPVVFEIAKSLTHSVKHQAHYLLRFNKILEDLRNEKGKLLLTKESVVEQAKHAHNKTEKIGKEVEKWFEDVKSLITDVEKLEEDAITNKTTCIFRWCPNCILRYRLGKKATKKISKLIELNAQSDFNYFSRLLTLPGMEYHSSGDFIYFESTRLARDQLLEALTDGKNCRVGLYGMGGSGKTTLVKEVGKEVEQSKLFDKVVFVVVSSPPDVRKIQDNIASSLGLKFEEEYESDRAKRLWLRLTNGEKILLILDDAWEKVDFKDIGIPSEDNYNNCNVLLTTRSVQVCASTKCQRMIPLSLLSDGDAWILFQKHAGITNDSSDNLKDVAKEIAKQCKRLPVAIVTLGSSLKDQSLEDWKLALTSLNNSKPADDMDEDLIRIYGCLRLSFDYLKSERVKKLFLLCSLFPKDYDIPLEDLTRFAKGLGLFGDVDSYETARSLMRAAKNKLIDSCLLLQDVEGYVKMHDLVHDMVQWIADNEIQFIMGPKKNMKALEESLSGKVSTLRYLHWHNMNDFPDRLECTKLEILLVSTYEEGSVEVPAGFFEGMKDLRVLALLNNRAWRSPILQLPLSIQLLTNLRMLRLRSLKLGDISILGSLKRLECFELIHCSINELPNRVVEMEELRLLNLTNCRIKRNPYEVIGRCSLLEELYFILNTSSGDPLDFENAAKFFKRKNSSPALQRYHIEIGGSFDLSFSADDSISRGISIENFDASTSNTTMKDLVQRAEILHLTKLQGGCRTIIPDIVRADAGDMSELIQLQLYSCSTIECVIDTTNVGNLNFRKLELLKVKYCPMLTSLFSLSMARTLIMLKHLEIHGCNELKYIITDERDEREEIVQDCHAQRTSGSTFPKLEILHIDECNHLEFIFPLSFAQDLPLLKTLKLSRSCELKYIFGQYQHEDPILHHNEKDIMLPLLDKITLTELPSFISIYPGSCDAMCLSLQKHGPILNATTNNNISIVPRSRQEDPNNSVGLHRSNQEWASPIDVSQRLLRQLLYIQKMKLTNCSKLISLFTLSTASTMLLKELTIEKCHALKRLITDDGDEHDQVNHGSVFSKLRKLSIRKCRVLEFVFPATLSEGLKQMKSLEIAEAPELKYVFTQYHQKDHSSYQKMNEIYINLPALEDLCLRNLPNILSFVSNNYYPTWPSLQKFILDECPKLSFMSINEVDHKTTEESKSVATNGSQSRDEDQALKEMQALETIYINKCKIGGIFQIKRLPNNGQWLISSLKSMTLHHLPELRYICKGQKQLMSLQNLVFLDVSGCRRLKAIFSVSVLKDLPQLRYLSIRNCEQLEQIIEDDDDQILSNHHYPQMFLPNLTTIDVQRCNNLKCLFSISTFHDLQRLEYLSIVDSSQLVEVFESKKSETLLGNDGFLLPSLNFLRLLQLPSLINICHCLQLQTKRDCQVFVHGCPKRTLPSTSNPGGDAESQQLQLCRSTEVPTLISASPHPSQSLSSIAEASGSTELPTSVSLSLPFPPTVRRSCITSAKTISPVRTTRDDRPSSKQASIMSSKEELVDFHDLFRIDSRRASLLDEAFAKYPHLWEWQSGLRPKYVKWGYESLADMLMFLKSETPKAMIDDSKKEEFERLYAELDSFGFDKGWLASIYQRVMEVQACDEKLKQLAELKLQESSLQEELNNVKAKMARIRDDLSKYDAVFDF